MGIMRGNPILYKYNVSDLVLYNIKDYFSYGFLEAGGYTNITFDSPASGFTQLKRVKDNRYADGRVYEGFGPNFVWQNDISTNDPSLSAPFQVSGIYINNTFLPISDGSYIVDYNNGRVILNSPLPSSSGVPRCEYTMSDIGVYTSDSPQFKRIIDSYDTLYNDLPNNNPSGLASILKQNRVWLPSVFISIKRNDHSPLQLGGGLYYNYDIMYHVFSDRPSINQSIMDIINDQEGKTLALFDINLTPNQLNSDGSLVYPSGYNDLDIFTFAYLTIPSLNQLTLYYNGFPTYKVLANPDGPYYYRRMTIEKSSARPITNKGDMFRSEIIQRCVIDGGGFG